MKKFIFLILFFLPFTWSCNSDETNSLGKPENDVDAARMFIRCALDGRYKDARKLIYPDSTNIYWLDKNEANYVHRMDATRQRSYRESQITVYDIRKINDSASVIIYSNTYLNKRDSVKAIRVGGDWLIDLKYSFLDSNNGPQ